MAEMPEVDKQILEEVKYFQEIYFTYDKPIPFNGLNLYPVKVKDYTEFLSCSTCCSLNKNDDPAGIKMTHLEYLIRKMQDEVEGPIWSMKFSKLLELCLHIQNCLKCPNCGNIMTYDELYRKFNDETIEDKASIIICQCGGQFKETVKYEQDEKSKKTVMYIDGHKFDGKQYNKMRKYILYQNLPDFKDDSWVDQAVRQDQAAKSELLSRGKGTATLERKIVGLCSKSNYKIEEIYEMTMRKFIQLLGIIDDYTEYFVTRLGLASGMSSLKKGATLEHWLYKKQDEGLYGKAVDADSYTDQIKNA